MMSSRRKAWLGLSQPCPVGVGLLVGSVGFAVAGYLCEYSII